MFKKISQRLTLLLAPCLAYWLIRFLGATMRMTHVGYDTCKKMAASGHQIIFAFWHGRLLMMPYAYPGEGVTILVSTHRDGELISRTVRGFGVDTVRGSTTRGWVGGVKGLLKAARDGQDLAITPDGPKGPACKAQMGVVQIARATGLPIVPVSFGASKKKPLAAGTRF